MARLLPLAVNQVCLLLPTDIPAHRMHASAACLQQSDLRLADSSAPGPQRERLQVPKSMA